MKVFMIGGTGLLGSEAARELIARGHEVSSLALPPLPAGAVLPPEMKLEFGNYLEMSDEELKGHLNGCEGFVFAAGVDERVEGPAPIYDMYKKYNVETVVQLSKGNISSQNVRIEFSLEDMDMSGFQQGATYEQIQAWVQEKYGFHVTHLNIAKTKRKYGIIERPNYNLPKNEDSKSPGTSKENEEAIIEAFKAFQMI